MNYLSIPKERLMALQQLDLQTAMIREESLRKQWKLEKKCLCVSELEKDELPWCQHVRNEVNKQNKEIEDKIWKKSQILALKSISYDKILH